MDSLAVKKTCKNKIKLHKIKKKNKLMINILNLKTLNKKIIINYLMSLTIISQIF
jgi:hypothetical protein